MQLREIVRTIEAEGLRCNCDLDNWEPERSTGHSWVCRIHKAAIARAKDKPMGQNQVDARVMGIRKHS